MGVVHDHHDVVGEVVIVSAGDTHDLVQWSVVAAHGEDAVGHDDCPSRPAGYLGELTVERRHVQMRIHGLAQRPGEADGVDDRVVIEFVGDHRGGRIDQRYQGSHHRRVGRGEDHPLRAAVERGQGAFQLHMGSVGARYEPHRAGPGPHRPGGFLLSPDYFRVQRQSQVGVGVHPDE